MQITTVKFARDFHLRHSSLYYSTKRRSISAERMKEMELLMFHLLSFYSINECSKMGCVPF